MNRLLVIPLLHRATHRVGLYLQARAAGVTQAEAHLLAHLHEAGGAASVADLYRAWAHKRSTLTDILDRLEDRALARRSVLASDRRSVLVRLTAKGRLSAAEVHRELLALEHDALAHIGAGARTGFDQVAGALAEAAATAAPASRTRRVRSGRRQD